jgi:hypothetical protein
MFLDNPLHVILNNSKLAYRIYVILIANKELIKKSYNHAVWTGRPSKITVNGRYTPKQ